MQTRARIDGSGGGPTKKGIEIGLRMALQLVRRGDLLVVAFSGHGVRIDEVDYLCPVGARLDDPKGTMVALDWVYEQMKQCNAPDYRYDGTGFRVVRCEG
ncbi:MAG: caspase family protein [Planctomycetes bacterium]|nr:caspase family protein [Planctomycetota bacterium]